MAGKGQGDYPTSAGILFGLGLGGFFDGIVLHQILQWHHMLTDAGYPATSIENLQINTFWDGLFHATTYIFVVMGLIVLWRASRRRHVRWSTKLLVGTLLIGFGLQPGRRDRRPSPARHPPCQRDSAAGAVDLLGRRFLDLGCRDVVRRLAPAQARAA